MKLIIYHLFHLWKNDFRNINKELADRVAGFRKRKKLSQQELAGKSGVSFGSVKRFEQTGEISLKSLTKIAIALDVETELMELFSRLPFSSIEKVINGQD